MLFSTLGMIRGRENRQRVLNHVRRILKPGGLFVVHVHNLWYNLYDPGGPWWLVKNLLTAAVARHRGGGQILQLPADSQYVPARFRRRELSGIAPGRIPRAASLCRSIRSGIARCCSVAIARFLAGSTAGSWFANDERNLKFEIR